MGFQKAASAVASGARSATNYVVRNAGTISTVAGVIATVATFLPPPAQIAVAVAVSAVAGAIDTAKSCQAGDEVGCASGIAGMVPAFVRRKPRRAGPAASKTCSSAPARAATAFCLARKC